MVVLFPVVDHRLDENAIARPTPELRQGRRIRKT